jgi:hypothetical protein
VRSRHYEFFIRKTDFSRFTVPPKNDEETAANRGAAAASINPLLSTLNGVRQEQAVREKTPEPIPPGATAYHDVELLLELVVGENLFLAQVETHITV